MKKGKINHTFVVLGYKSSPYLNSCLESLLNQSVESKIIYSASSISDEVQDTLKKFGIKWVIGSGEGIGNDWNNGLRCVKTRYVTLAHQDDVYLPTYTEDNLKVVDKNTIISFCDYREIDKNNLLISTNINLTIKRIILLLLGKDKKALVSFSNPICCPSVMFNKDKIKNFLFDTNLKFTLDWKAWVQFSNLKGNFVYINKALISHRIHDLSETYIQTLNKNRKNEELLILEMIWPKFVSRLIRMFYSLNSM